MNIQMITNFRIMKSLFSNILLKHHKFLTSSCSNLKEIPKHEECVNNYDFNIKGKEIIEEKKKSVAAGDKVIETRYISQEDVNRFAKISGDHNPIHSANGTLPKSIVHGALLNGLVSGVIGTRLPGPGTLVAFQTLNFPNPCYAEEKVKIIVEIVSVRKIIVCKYLCTVVREKEVTVLHGEAKLIQMKEFFP